MPIASFRTLLPLLLLLVPQGELEPFRGITVGGELRKDLFRLGSTGVSTEPIVAAANRLLEGLDDDERAILQKDLDSDLWRRWDNRTGARRHGLLLENLTIEKRNLALALLEESLSARGLKKSRDIMRMDGRLKELTGRPTYGEWKYAISIFGKPSSTEPWGWQIDGHHLIVNYLVLGDQVVMAPVFMGTEPTEATEGQFRGTTAMISEEGRGLALMNSLMPEQQALARIKNAKGQVDNIAEAYKDNVDLDYAGIPATKLEADQRETLLELIREYVDNMREGHAKIKMEEVEKYLDETYFAWIGESKPDSVFYYRVHSPVILIEFDHQRPAALGGSAPSRNHVHTIVRTPNGNDYGKDLLRQHHEKHRH